jgi:SAM-dependent methyltransferase
VTAFDVSPVGVERARELAAETGVVVDYREAGIEDWDWSQTYDAVCAVFVQFAPPALRTLLFEWIAEAVAPGGVVLLHGYAPRQVGYGTGGPPFAENMYELPMLHEAFAGWGVVHAADYDAEVDEGAGHSGRSALIDFVAVKP